MDRDFLFHMLLGYDFTEYAISGSDRAGMPKVNRNHMFAYSFQLPPLEAQKEIAGLVLKEVTTYYERPIVTEISPLGTFYEAEEQHQDYYRNNMTQGYCSAVITPKLTKLRKMHADKIKKVKV